LSKSYRELEERFRRMSNLSDSIGVLQWDMAVMMPPGGVAARAEQLATLKVLHHELLTDPRIGDLLADAAAGAGSLDPWQTANLHEMSRAWVRANAVDANLIDAFSRSCSETETVWRHARPSSDFTLVEPLLRRQLDLVREIAARKGEALDLEPYDALLDQFEPEARAAEIERLFADLAEFLPGFITRVVEHQTRAASRLPLDPVPIERRRALGRRIMGVIGFDFRHGRLDESAHPFSSGVPDDLRITTRYEGDDFVESLMAVIHETGHALYEHNLPAEWRGQPVGQARGMALHESQSLLLEMQACRSREFIRFLAPLIREEAEVDGPNWVEGNLYRQYTHVERGFIRVDADEVTYPAHVILRYRLARAMIAGTLDVADLPSAWNDGMEDLLGVQPPDDRRGCLQDLHWYDGAWGYFPTYTLGAMIAAQLFDAATRADAGIRPALAKGDFRPLYAWLVPHVHGVGSSQTTERIVADATGRPLDPEIYKRHLEMRYLDLA